MLKRSFQNGVVFLISFFVVLVSSAPASYSRPPAKKTKIKNVETADKQDKSKEEIEPIVPATNITTPLRPILVKPMRPPHRIGTVMKPIAPQSLKFEKPPMLSESIRVTTLTKPEPVKTEAMHSAQDTTTTTSNKSESTAKQKE